MEFKKEKKFIMDIENDQINHTDSNDIRQGLWRTWYDNGQLRGEGYGLYRCWSFSGRLMWEEYHANGIQEGEKIEYGY